MILKINASDNNRNTLVSRKTTALVYGEPRLFSGIVYCATGYMNLISHRLLIFFVVVGLLFLSADVAYSANDADAFKLQ